MCQITGDPLLSFIVTIVFWEVVLRFSPCQDAETLQSHICQAEQRLTEKSPLSLFLMKPFLRGVCLRIHVVIALGYIFSPVGEALLKTLETRALSKSGASEESLWAVFYAGSACGCLLWLFPFWWYSSKSVDGQLSAYEHALLCTCSCFAARVL